MKDINKLPVIGFAGLTHLGLNSAVASAEKGFKTYGYHYDEGIIENLNNGNTHVLEPGLNELLEKNIQRLIFSPNSDVLAKCDIIYIAFDVPTDGNGKSDLNPIKKIIERVISEIKSDALLVILCQVPPGFCRKINWPPSQCFYQVETLIFGKALERAINPERIILGVANSKNKIDDRLKIFLNAFNCPILPMNYESAELAKISINLCLIASISTANTLAEM